MNSLRLRLSLWFVCSFLAVLAVFVFFTYRHLDAELRLNNWEGHFPDKPDWNLRGSYSEAEVQDIMRKLVRTTAVYSLPLIAVVITIGMFLARKSMGPIASVNTQLQQIGAKNLHQKITLTEVDVEFRDLLRQINDLLARLNASFTEMSEYAAKVAHELRTPLTIVRLKLEQAAGAIPPELSEDLQSELQRLTHVVDQSLLIAKAEQGRLPWQVQRFDLSAMLEDLVKDFDLLAAADGRRVHLRTIPDVAIETDPKHFKQILHGLLSNALKHGQGEIKIRLTRRRTHNRISIFNRARHRPLRSDQTLGLGLRVVAALLHLQPDLNCRHRQSARYYLAHINCAPCAPVSKSKFDVSRNKTPVAT